MKSHRFLNLAILLFVLMWLVPSSQLMADSRHDFHITVHRQVDQAAVSVCPLHIDVVSGFLGVSDLNAELGKSIRYAILRADGSFTTSATMAPYGSYLDAEGHSTTRAKAVASSQYKTANNAFNVNVMPDKMAAGSELTAVQCFLNTETADTLAYHVTIRIDGTKAIESDEPAFFHRPDRIESWAPVPYMRRNEQEPVLSNCLQVQAGDKVTFGVRTRSEGDEMISFSVKNPAGTVIRTFSKDDFELAQAEASDAGEYTLTVRYKTAAGRRTSLTYPFVLDVQTEAPGTPFDWDADGPKWSYDFREQYPNGFPQPTKTFTFKQHNGKNAHMMAGEWWSVYWGDNLNTEVWDGKAGEAVDGDRKHAMTNILKKFDEDYAYIRNEMGWPPDLAARSGYKSFIYVFGSGINNDNASNTETGGYQGYTQPSNANRGYACVYASYYPMSRFRDDADKLWGDGNYQREAMIHEGIHAIFADYPGCKSSAWFQEAGNVWLQGAMGARRGQGAQVSGWLGVGNLICPFMPIECYSGWLQDGSFGGPAAEGVNMYNGSQQICTWRNLIGGVQYGETFPIFLGLNVGYGAIPWIWRYCKDYVLKGIAEGNKEEGVEGIGDEGMRQLILHYRAKLATMDFKESSEGMRNLLNGSFGTIVKAEWEPYWINVEPFALTPYQTCKLNDADGWLAPDTITNPGWSGGNIIPIHVTGNGCVIEFRPEDDHMRCQLCYRTKDGRCFYSQPVLCGEMTLKWNTSDRPANDVIFCVPCNTDYIYTGDAQRKHHYDYRIRLGEGALAPAATNIRWYFYEQKLTDPTFTGIDDIVEGKSANGKSTDFGFRILSSVLKGGQRVQLDLNGVNPADVEAHLVGLSGVVIASQTVAPDATVQLPVSCRSASFRAL